MGKYNPAPYQLDLTQIPKLVTPEIPGPRSKELHSRAAQYYRGLSGQVRLFPVAFEKGEGCMLEDADGNLYYSGVVGYSPERYAYINRNDAENGPLAKRLVIYGDAARAYFN